MAWGISFAGNNTTLKRKMGPFPLPTNYSQTLRIDIRFVHSADISIFQTLLGTPETSSSNNNFMVFITTSNQIRFSSNGSFLDTTFSPINGQEHVLSITVDTAKTVTLQWDGGPIVSRSYPNLAAALYASLFVGGLSDTLNNNFANPFLGQLRRVETWVGGVKNGDYTNATGTGTRFNNSLGANTADQVGSWPANDTEFVFYNTITNTRLLYPLNIPAGTPVSINLNNYFTGATSYAIQSGSLPAGLTLSGSIISGTVAANAASQFTIRASNSIDILDVVAVVQVRSHYLAYNSNSFIHSGYQGKIRFPSWVGSGAANWSVEIDFRITNLSVDSSLMGREGTTGAFTVWASGAIGIRGWVASAGGIIAQGVRYKTKLAREGNVLRIYVKPFDTANYGAAVLTTPVNTGSYTFDILGFSDASSLVIDYFSVSFEGAGASYIESWNENNIPRIGTSWIGANGNAITLAGTQGALDAWWTPYGQGSGNWYLNNATGGNSVINIPSVTIGNNTGDYIEMKAVASSGNESGIYRIVGVSSGYSALIGAEPAKLSISIGSSNTAITAGYTQPAIGEVFTVKLRKSGTNQYIASMNGVDFAPFTAYSTFTVNQLFRWATESTGAFKGGIYYVAISTNGGVSATRYYDAKASGGSGNQLLDTVGGQHGTQAGTWPTDNSEWRFIPPAGDISFSGTLGKTSLTATARTLALSLGFQSSIVKTNAIVSPDQLGVTLGAVNVLSKNAYNVALKQLSLTVGVNLPFAGLLSKTNYPVSNKQLDVVSGVSANIGRQGLSILPKQLTVSAGFRAGVQKQQLSLSGKQEGVSIGHLLSINEQHLTIQNKQLQLVTGTSVSFLGVLNKTALNVSPKQLGVLAGTNVPVNLTLNKASLILSPKQLGITAGTSLPFNGTLVKTSYNLSGKTLSGVAGTVLTLQKQALQIVSKQLSMGDTIYPIIPIERVFTFTDKNNRTYVFKQTTNVYVMNN